MIVSIANQKGGVAKSTTTHALGTGLFLKDFKTLLVDMDGQGNMSLTANASHKASIYDVMTKSLTADEAIQKTENVDIIASNLNLKSLNVELTSVGKEYRLKEALESIRDKYDYIIIDTPPDVDILTINALTASDCVIIPAQAEIYSIQGINQIYETIKAIKEYTNKDLKIKGILLTRHNPRSILSRDMEENIKKIANNMNTFVYSTVIRECVSIKEAQASQQSIFEYASKSNAAKDYTDFINELLEKE